MLIVVASGVVKSISKTKRIWSCKLIILDQFGFFDLFFVYMNEKDTITGKYFIEMIFRLIYLANKNEMILRHV